MKMVTVKTILLVAISFYFLWLLSTFFYVNNHSEDSSLDEERVVGLELEEGGDGDPLLTRGERAPEIKYRGETRPAEGSEDENEIRYEVQDAEDQWEEDDTHVELTPDDLEDGVTVDVTEPFSTTTGIPDGPGEGGRPVYLGTDEKLAAEPFWNIHSFNSLTSDKIALNRTIKDLRHPLCELIKYPDNLPTVSVSLYVHNEAWSILLRTITSIINRSPPHLLKEIIVIEDGSDLEYLKSELDNHVERVWEGKVKVLHTDQWLGIIPSRNIAGHAATSDVVAFMCSHIEVGVGWLEPLLDRISEDKRTVVWPVMDVIHDDTFEHMGYSDISVVGGFTWDLGFTWMKIPKKTKALINSPTDPVRSPNTAPLFLIHRDWWNSLGGHDPQMLSQGAEFLEVAFKVWMCGGTVEIIPCSRIGHIFKQRMLDRMGAEKGPLDPISRTRNAVRTVETWMDSPYKELFYQQVPYAKNIDYGDISDRIEIRRRLNCKPFQHFLDEAIGMDEVYVPSQTLLATDGLRFQSLNFCLDIMGALVFMRPPPRFGTCHNQGGAQQFELTLDGEIRVSLVTCLEAVPGSRPGQPPLLNRCLGHTNTQKWIHQVGGGPVKSVETNLCLDSGSQKIGDFPLLKTCNGRPEQNWVFGRYISPPARDL